MKASVEIHNKICCTKKVGLQFIILKNTLKKAF